MPSLVPLLRLAALTALVALLSAPARAAGDVVHDLLPPPVTFTGVIGAQSRTATATPTFAASGALPGSVFHGAGSILQSHDVHGNAGFAPADAMLNEDAPGRIVQTERHPARLGIWNGTSWLASWTTPMPPNPGMRWRTPGIAGSFTTERLRLNWPDGLPLYPLPRFMASGAPGAHLPESRTWPLLLAGIFVMAAIVRRHLRTDLPE